MRKTTLTLTALEDRAVPAVIGLVKAGVNRLYGGADDDILVGGRTTLDGDDAKLREARRLWLTPNTTAAQRKTLLTPVLSAASLLGGTSYGEPGDGDNLLWGIELYQLPAGTV